MSDNYTIDILGRAKASLKRLDKTVAGRIVKKLRWLVANAETLPHSALTGQWSGYYRL